MATLVNRVCRLSFVLLVLGTDEAQGDDFRDFDWGASASEVLRHESAEPLGREELDGGRFLLRFSETMFDLDATINYIFDEECGQLIRGFFAFAEPISESHFLGVVKAFSDIYGETEKSQSLEGGHLMVWESSSSTIQVLHGPPGAFGDALAHVPPTSITYSPRTEKSPDCDATDTAKQ